jgi:UDP-sulfoquinovose synthase
LKILVIGSDGYIGWSLAVHLLRLGHEVIGVDNFSRRKTVEEMGSWSATPIQSMEQRLKWAKSAYQQTLRFHEGDLRDYEFVADVLKSSSPEAIVHLGEQPSAPYSMIDVEHAVYTQHNNVIGTLNLLFAMRDHAPQAHLVKLGTMGEYGTPDMDIPEGFFDVEYNSRRSRLMFPRQPGSFYHASKVHDTHNIMLACKIWNLRSTDIMQGVVYGTRSEEINPSNSPEISTRFDFDEAFGTAINRYCAEAVIGHPLTIYGKGGQKRGFLALIDSLQCLTLICQNPPDKGEYRVFNQIDDVYDVSELANKVQRVGTKKGLHVEVNHVPNPRKESEEHHYKVEAQHLQKLGFKPTRTLEDELGLMLDDLIKYRSRIVEKSSVIDPATTWAKGRTKQLKELSPLLRRSLFSDN